MTLKMRVLKCLRRLFIILVSLTVTLFTKKMLISTWCIHGFIPNSIKKSVTVSIIAASLLTMWPKPFRREIFLFFVLLRFTRYSLNYVRFLRFALCISWAKNATSTPVWCLFSCNFTRWPKFRQTIYLNELVRIQERWFTKTKFTLFLFGILYLDVFESVKIRPFFTLFQPSCYSSPQFLVGLLLKTRLLTLLSI